MSARDPIEMVEIAGGGEVDDRDDGHRMPGFQARGYGQTGGPDEQRARFNSLPFFGQLGVSVRPAITRSLFALSFAQKNGGRALLALFDKALTHATATEAGETRLYAAGKTSVCIRLLGGRIEIRVGDAANEIQLGPDATGYAGKNVARVDDEVSVGTLAGTAPPGGGPVTFTFTPVGGAPVVGATATITAKIAAGAPKVKA